MPNTIWQTYKPEPEQPGFFLKIASLNFWVKKKDDEVWVATEYKSDADPDKKPSDNSNHEVLKWARFACKNPAEDVTISPVFPDYPIIVSSEYPLRISSGSRIQIFTRIPVWVQVSLNKSGYVLTNMPSFKLSRTWFGNPLEGELCYWLSTKARRKLSEIDFEPYLINCPITIINKTNDDLNFEKFCFRVDRLSIFTLNDLLWADETQIEYRGEEQNSDIAMTGKLPVNLGKGELLTKARNPVSRSFATRTFKKLFDDTFISDL